MHLQIRLQNMPNDQIIHSLKKKKKKKKKNLTQNFKIPTQGTISMVVDILHHIKIN